MPDPNEAGDFPIGSGRVVIRNASDNKVSLTVYENTSQTEVSTTFSPCEIIKIETSNVNPLPAEFILIQPDKSKVKLGDVGHRIYRDKGVETKRTALFLSILSLSKRNIN